MSEDKSISSGSETGNPIVDTVAGKVRGCVDSDKGIFTFKGLHYGAPTGGLGRFRPPRPVESWEGIKDATEYGPVAPQVRNLTTVITDSVMKEPGQSEDCLVLNVWTPGLEGKRPVMVWLHGGGFELGSGSESYYNGTNLSRRGDVVVVTLNHRLGALGFLYLDEIGGDYYSGSGMAGMLDIELALRWVRNNIESFGGDPGNVTIFGQSGGGSKVTTLLAMPSAKGLFHRGIVESGPGLNGTLPARGNELAKSLMEKLEIADPFKLQAIPFEDILKAISELPINLKIGRGEEGPVLDGKYLPVHPFDPVAAPTAAGIPIIVGTTKDEMLYMLMRDPERDVLTEEELIERIKPRTGDKTDQILSVYRKSRPEASPWDLLIAIQTEGFRLRSLTLAERQTAASGAPVYNYQFAFEVNDRMKAAHAMEIPFVFSNTGQSGMINRPEAKQVESQMSEAWIAFARTGNPNHPGIPEWPPYTVEKRSTMVFDTETRVVDDLMRDERLAWQDINARMSPFPDAPTMKKE